MHGTKALHQGGEVDDELCSDWQNEVPVCIPAAPSMGDGVTRSVPAVWMLCAFGLVYGRTIDASGSSRYLVQMTLLQPLLAADWGSFNTHAEQPGLE